MLTRPLGHDDDDGGGDDDDDEEEEEWEGEVKERKLEERSGRKTIDRLCGVKSEQQYSKHRLYHVYHFQRAHRKST